MDMGGLVDVLPTEDVCVQSGSKRPSEHKPLASKKRNAGRASHTGLIK